MLGIPNRNVNPHIRCRSMGPIRYVRRERRECLFLPTGAPNLAQLALLDRFASCYGLASPTGIEPVSNS